MGYGKFEDSPTRHDHSPVPEIECPKIKCSALWLCHTFPFAHELAIPCLARLQKQRDHMQVSQNGGTPQSSSKSDSTIWILKPMATWGSLILWTLHRSMSDINVHPTSSPPSSGSSMSAQAKVHMSWARDVYRSEDLPTNDPGSYNWVPQIRTGETTLWFFCTRNSGFHHHFSWLNQRTKWPWLQ